MISTEVRIYEVEIDLEVVAGSPRISVGGLDFPLGGPIQLAQGIHMIRFQIPSSSEAIFPSTPILWMRDGVGVDELPPGILVRWQTLKQFALVIFNAVGVQHTCHFRLVLSQDDLVVVSHDPTIICDPPGTTASSTPR